MQDLNEDSLNLIKEVRDNRAKLAMNNFLRGNKDQAIKAGNINDYLASKELSSKEELKQVLAATPDNSAKINL